MFVKNFLWVSIYLSPLFLDVFLYIIVSMQFVCESVCMCVPCICMQCVCVCVWVSPYEGVFMQSVYLCECFYWKPKHQYCPVGWGCKIHRLHLCWRVRPPQRVSRYDTKQSDGEVPVMLELWGIRGTPSWSSLPGPLWLGVVVSDRVLCIGQIELNCVLMLNWIARNKTALIFLNFVLMQNWIVWNRTDFDIETLNTKMNGLN